MGDTGTGKTTLAMLVSKAALRGRPLGRDLLAAEAARADPPHLRLRARRRLLPRLLRAPHLGRPPPHRRPRRREALRLGARAALRAGQRALRGPALDPGHHQPRPARSSRSRSARARSRAWSRSAATRCRCSATGSRERVERRRAPPGRAAQRPQSPGHARRGDSRRPVGRRGQGQGHRPARRARRRDRPLPGRQQRRPHDRPRRRGVQVPPDPLRDPLPGQDLRDRQRRGARPAHPARRDRRAAAPRRSTSATCGSPPTPT